MHLQRFLIAAVAGILAVSPVMADPPQKIASFKNWSAYVSGAGDSKVCYALSEPTAKEPVKVKRDAVFFLINDWPNRPNGKAKSEPEVVPGYQYKDKSDVIAEVGPNKFTFFTQNDNGSGAAWIKEQDDETRLVDAMRKGAEIVVMGTSKRGTQTRDTYSLAGLSEALDEAHKACGL